MEYTWKNGGVVPPNNRIPMRSACPRFGSSAELENDERKQRLNG